MRTLLQQLAKRKLVQWALTYAACAWIVMQVVDVLSDRWPVPLALQRGLDLLLGMGFLACLILAWYHGEKGRQRVSGSELLLLALLLGLSGFLLGALRQNSPAGSAATASLDDEDSLFALSDTRFAVFPFRVQGGPELKYLDEGLMTLLSEAVDGVGDARAVDPIAIMTRLRAQDGDVPSLNLAAARRIASHLGAGRFVVGEVVDVGDSIRIIASLYELRKHGDPVAHASASGDSTQLPRLVETLAQQLLARIPLGTGARLENVATVQAANHHAYRTYLQAEALLRRGWFDSAGVKLWEAVRADSAFALAWLRLHYAQGWGAEGNLQESLERAGQHRDRLTVQDQQLLEGLTAFHRGDGRRAEQLARTLVGRFPDHVDGWYLLAATRLIYHWHLGIPVVETRRAVDRIMALDSAYPPAVSYAAGLALSERRYADAQALLSRGPAGGGAGQQRFANRAALVAVSGSQEEQQRLARELESAPEVLVFLAAGRTTVTDSIAAAAEMWRQLARGPFRTEWARATGAVHLAHIEVARGRWSAGWKEYERAAEVTRDAPAVAGILASIPVFQRPPEELQTLIRNLRDWHPSGSEAPIVNDGVIPAPLGAAIRPYTLGLLSARLGDSASAFAHARALEDPAEPADPAGLRRDLAREIRALAALQQGRPAQALAFLGDHPGPLTFWVQVFTSLYRRPIARLLRAEALVQLGRDVEALRWYDTFNYPYLNWEYTLLAPIYYRIGEIHERRGDTAAAIEYYTRFVNRWRNADPEYQQLVTDTRSRIGHLSAEAGRHQRESR